MGFIVMYTCVGYIPVHVYNMFITGVALLLYIHRHMVISLYLSQSADTATSLAFPVYSIFILIYF